MSEPAGPASGPFLPVPGTEPAPPGDDLEDLPGWIPQPRTNRLTPVLVAALVAVIGFAGGVLAERRHNPGTGTAPVAFTGGARSFGQGFAGQGFGGQGTGGPGFGGQGTGGLPGQGAAGAPPGGEAAGGVGAGGPAAGVPVVVGTVVDVSGTTLRVRNFAGTVVVVRVPAGTPVTVAGLGGLRAGLPVSVAGTRAADGSVTATAVVNRSAG